MIWLYTDFGYDGPYVGQMTAVLARTAPGIPAVSLMHDAPTFRPQAAAYLLAALFERTEPGDVIMGVVDPGVGTERRAVVVDVDGRRLVGPDNGLFEMVVRRAADPEAVDRRLIAWRPPNLSNTFHGRDLFAPVAGMLAAGQAVETTGLDRLNPDAAAWPDVLPRIIYTDRFGNAMTGLGGDSIDHGARLKVADRTFRYARTFGDVLSGEAFWYVNAIGLVEIALNQGSAAHALGLDIGAEIEVAVD